MKVYVLDTGYLETDKNNVVGGATVGTNSNPYVKNEWIKLPVMAVLIDHPSGKILYDLWSNPQDSVYTSEIYGPPIKSSGLLYDNISFFKSINKVRALEKT